MNWARDTAGRQVGKQGMYICSNGWYCCCCWWCIIDRPGYLTKQRPDLDQTEFQANDSPAAPFAYLFVSLDNSFHVESLTGGLFVWPRVERVFFGAYIYLCCVREVGVVCVVGLVRGCAIGSVGMGIGEMWLYESVARVCLCGESESSLCYIPVLYTVYYYRRHLGEQV